MSNKSLSVIVPAYNEEKNLKEAVESVIEVVAPRFADYEILIFNDASQDKTGVVADELARNNALIKVIHNSQNMNLGYNYREGVRSAQKDYIIMVPGDNEIAKETIADVLDHVGEADIIVPFIANPEIRPFLRRFLSGFYTFLVNALFGLRVKYYNGIVLHKSKVLKSYKIKTDSFAYQTEILINLIKQGFSYKETPMRIQARAGRSSALRWKNIKKVISSVARLFWEVRVKGVKFK